MSFYKPQKGKKEKKIYYKKIRYESILNRLNRFYSNNLEKKKKFFLLKCRKRKLILSKYLSRTHKKKQKKK